MRCKSYYKKTWMPDFLWESDRRINIKYQNLIITVFETQILRQE